MNGAEHLVSDIKYHESGRQHVWDVLVDNIYKSWMFKDVVTRIKEQKMTKGPFRVAGEHLTTLQRTTWKWLREKKAIGHVKSMSQWKLGLECQNWTETSDTTCLLSAINCSQMNSLHGQLTSRQDTTHWRRMRDVSESSESLTFDLQKVYLLSLYP